MFGVGRAGGLIAQADWASITCRRLQQTTFAAKPQALLPSLSQGTRAITVFISSAGFQPLRVLFPVHASIPAPPNYCNKAIYRVVGVSGEGGWGTPAGGGFLCGGDLPISLDVDPRCLSVRLPTPPCTFAQAIRNQEILDIRLFKSLRGVLRLRPAFDHPPS